MNVSFLNFDINVLSISGSSSRSDGSSLSHSSSSRSASEGCTSCTSCVHEFRLSSMIFNWWERNWYSFSLNSLNVPHRSMMNISAFDRSLFILITTLRIRLNFRSTGFYTCLLKHGLLPFLVRRALIFVT